MREGTGLRGMRLGLQDVGGLPPQLPAVVRIHGARHEAQPAGGEGPCKPGDCPLAGRALDGHSYWDQRVGEGTLRIGAGLKPRKEGKGEP